MIMIPVFSIQILKKSCRDGTRVSYTDFNKVLSWWCPYFSKRVIRTLTRSPSYASFSNLNEVLRDCQLVQLCVDSCFLAALRDLRKDPSSEVSYPSCGAIPRPLIVARSASGLSTSQAQEDRMVFLSNIL